MTARPMANVSIRSVTKRFDAVEVVHGVTFDIADGEFVVLVGPSGCGKSTLLRMIAGLEDITGGEISIGGRVVNHVKPKDRDVAMVFQNYALYPHMSVAKNMGFSLKLRGEKREVIDRKVSEAAAVLGLAPYLDRLPRQLSGGQRQRVAMGRSIVRDPRVFLFDEPLSNLDAKLRVQMRTEIKALHQRLKTTTVYVTHDQIEAMTMADRIVVLRDGRVEQIGAPLELYDRPANLFVAGFIGSPAMNVLEGSIADEGGRLLFRMPGGLTLPLPAVPEQSGTPSIGQSSAETPRERDVRSLAVRAGQFVHYGVRPEHFVLLDSPSAPGVGVPAVVAVVEPTGSETQVFMRLGNHHVLGVFRERVTLRPGDTVSLVVDPERVHLFDRETGQRITPA